MKENVSTVSLIMVAVVTVSTLLIGPALTGSSRSALADTSSGCKNSADKLAAKQKHINPTMYVELSSREIHLHSIYSVRR
jgi:hypothetical protein